MRSKKILSVLLAATIVTGFTPSIKLQATTTTNATIEKSQIIGLSEYNNGTTITMPQNGTAFREYSDKNLFFGPGKSILTGIYKKAGQSMTINISYNSQSQYDAVRYGFTEPVLKDHNKSHNMVGVLKPGENIIDAKYEGVLYLENDYFATATAPEVTITGGNRIPHLDITKNHTIQDWNYMLNTYKNAPAIEIIGNNSMITVGIDSAKYIKDPIELISAYDEIIQVTNDFVGYDDNDPSKIHRAPKQKHLYRESEAYGFLYAWTDHMGFTPQVMDHILDPEKVRTNSWGVWHETGHTYQQTSWYWPELQEVTVNIYSLALQRHFGQPSRLLTENRYADMFKYMEDPNKNYHLNNDAFVKVGMFWQLDLAFGSDYYPKLHRKLREIAYKNPPMSEEKRMQNLVTAAAEVANADLTPFFEMWGYQMTEETKATLSKYPKLTQEIWKLTDADVTNPEVNTAPELSGVTDKTIYVGDFIDLKAGVTAADKEDGDLTNKIQISGTVNTSKAGVYTITYTVTDSNGLSTTKVAKITVLEKEVTPTGSYDKNKVYYSGDIVTFNGSEYKARGWTQNNQPDISAEWEFIGPGTQVWNDKKPYYKDEIVSFNGNKYKSKYWNQNDMPSNLNAWTLIK